jgi:hypothetical protein
MSKKSYWTGVVTDTPGSQRAILSWLSPLCDGFTVESAQVLCDIATDREKKLKAVVIDGEGRRRTATRTFGKTFSVSLSAAQPRKAPRDDE